MSSFYAGEGWVDAVGLAERALERGCCAESSACAWRALTTLVGAGELAVAETHALRVAGKPSARGRIADEVAVVRGRIARHRGDFDAALDLLATVTGAGADRAVRMLAVTEVVGVLLARGEVRTAADLVTAQELDPVTRDDGVRLPAWRVARGALSYARGDFPAALAEFTASGRLLAAGGVRNPAVLSWRGLAALSALRADRAELAIRLAREEYRAAAGWGEPRTMGCALSVLAVVDGRDRDVELLREAAQLLEVAQAKAEHVKVLCALGTRLRGRNEPVTAARFLRQATSLAEEVGDRSLARRARAECRKLAEPPRGPALTDREAAVAKLARAGYSNKEIAGKLFLALRTVELHLSRAYRKLGIRGRAGLRTAVLG
ncbi:helix-turn-helix transcriptional regulator [Amycolatopsis minnesotensis]